MNNYIKGIVGGFLGGLVASIPWIIIYIYGSMLLSILAGVIGYGVYYGYNKFNGRVDRNLPMIITVISLLVVVLVNSVIIPMILLFQTGYQASFENLMLLYSNVSFCGIIVKDLVVSIIFTFIGISSLTKQLKNQF